MDLERHYVLIIEQGDAELERLRARLRTLSLPDVTIADPDQADQVLREGRIPALIIIDDAVGLDGARTVLATAKALFPEVPFMWLYSGDREDLFFEADRPDTIVSTYAPAHELATTADSLLRASFYPDPLINAFRVSITSIMRASFRRTGHIAEVSLKSNRNVLAYINSIIQFVGRNGAGRIMVSSSKTYLADVHRSLFDAPSATMEDAEDVAAEIANQLAGQMKSYLVDRNVNVELALPITVRGQQSDIRYKAAHPSLVFVFEDERGTLYVEAYFDILNVHEVAARPQGTAHPPGAALFF